MVRGVRNKLIHYSVRSGPPCLELREERACCWVALTGVIHRWRYVQKSRVMQVYWVEDPPSDGAASTSYMRTRLFSRLERCPCFRAYVPRAGPGLNGANLLPSASQGKAGVRERADSAGRSLLHCWRCSCKGGHQGDSTPL